MQVKVTEIDVTSQCSAWRQLSPPLFIHYRMPINRRHHQVTINGDLADYEQLLSGIERGRSIQLNVVKIWELEQKQM